MEETTPMDTSDRDALLSVLYAFERFWIEAMKQKHLWDHPEDVPHRVQEVFSEEAQAVFHPLIDALREGQQFEEHTQALLQVVNRLI
jgi:hypothetical protein